MEGSSNTSGAASAGHFMRNVIKQPITVIIRSIILQLMTIIDQSIKPRPTLHFIMGLWRFLQIYIPSFLIGFNQIYASAFPTKTSLNVLSVVAHFIPPDSREKGCPIYGIIYFAIVFIFIFSTFLAGYFYRKNAYIPIQICTVIIITQYTVMYIIHPPALMAAGETIGMMFTGRETIIGFVSIILVVIGFLLFIIVLQRAIGISIVFRPNSFQTINETPQTFIVVFSALESFFIGLARVLPLYGTLICLVLACASLFILGLIAFNDMSMINLDDRKLLASGAFASMINIIIGIVHLFVPREMGEIEFFVFIGTFVIHYIIFNFVFNSRVQKILIFLDTLYDNIEMIEVLSSPRPILRSIITGFTFNHPVMFWQIFKYSTERWPDDRHLWLLFGKFVAIYPEEQRILQFVCHNMVTKKFSDNSSKVGLEQMLQIMQRREANLSPLIKTRIQHVGRVVSSTKHKVRHVWDQVLQGNVHDMEAAIISAYESVQKCRTEYTHLLEQYPNNRFVVRSYAIFVRDVLANAEETRNLMAGTRLLARGLRIKEDQSFLLGRNTFPLMLPKSPATQNEVTSVDNGLENNSEPIIEDETDEENRETLADDLIAHLRVPSSKFGIIFSIFLCLIGMAVPIVIVTAEIPVILNDLEQPILIVQHASLIRSILMQIPMLMYHYIMEDRGLFDPPTGVNSPESFGGANSTKEQLLFSAKTLIQESEELIKYIDYGVNDKKMMNLRYSLYQKVILYARYDGVDSNGKPTSSNPDQVFSLSEISSDFIVSVMEVMEYEDPSDIDLSSNFVANPILNAERVSSQLSKVLVIGKTFFDNKKESYNSMVKIYEYSLLPIILLLNIIFVVTYCVHLNQNKLAIYSALMSLPKQVVSAVSDNLSNIKRDSGSTDRSSNIDELSKQEENILKTFSTATDKTTGGKADLIFVGGLFTIMYALSMGTLFLGTGVIYKDTDLYAKNAGHLDNIIGSSGYMLGSILALCHWVGVSMETDSEKYVVGTQTLEGLRGYVNSRMKKSRDYYIAARFGTTDGETPFPTFQIFLDNSEWDKCSTDVNRKDVREALICLPPALRYVVVNPVVQAIMRNGKYTEDQRSNLNNIYYLSVFVVHDKLFYPMFAGIQPTISAGVREYRNQSLPAIILLILIGVVIEIIYVVVTNKIESRLLFAVHLFKQCPPNALMQSQKVAELLSGHFNFVNSNESRYDKDFFDNIVANLRDSVIIADQNKIVVSANKATADVLELDPKDIVGKPMSSIFGRDCFHNVPLERVLAGNSEPVMVEMEHSDQTKDYLEATSINVGSNLVLTSRNVTQDVMYDNLIATERAKSDKTLMSILPPSLVPRVQAGEPNINFAVQSASILFLDIVEFTPWCASNEPAFVMKTLNDLFREFDALVAAHPSLTKIKCIGDCYMCAGGIFMEVNQPAVHAKEIVEFGLEAIEVIEMYNKEHGTKLRIRVGINTGGPLVAGVIGTGKPTFEILGPAINMAQQMEHHGVPMQVHISRATYEIVYGGVFDIRERGQIEIKQGTVVTYLVTKKLEKA